MTTAGVLAQSPARPNVLVLIADQWRAQALPPGDRDLIAPNLARLLEASTEFDRAYTCYPLCSPSRAAILTGRYPHTCKVLKSEEKLPETEVAISDVLKKAGYATGYIGKWHLDGDARPGYVPPGPRRHGFDFWAAFNRGHQYFDSVYFTDSDLEIQVKRFEPDYQTDLAIQFLQQNQKKPFCLFLSWGPPHTPRRPPPDVARMYKPAQLRLRENVPSDYVGEAREGLAGYYGLCTALDRDLGRLLDTLDQLNLAGDTILVFTSDHGDMAGSHGLEFKNLPYEESARIPLVIRYPRKMTGGNRNDLPVSSVDLMPTLLGMCGVDAPSGVQGHDLSAVLLNGKGDRPESIYSYGQLGSEGEWRMVVRGLDKLVVDRSLEVTHMYSLGPDPFEMQNRARDPGVRILRDSLRALLRDSMRRAGDRMSTSGLKVR